MTDREIAEAHVKWYMSRLKEQMGAWFDVTERLLIDNFEHGLKHGRELERDEIKIRRELPKDV